jgi:hypothetical protein
MRQKRFGLVLWTGAADPKLIAFSRVNGSHIKGYYNSYFDACNKTTGLWQIVWYSVAHLCTIVPSAVLSMFSQGSHPNSFLLRMFPANRDLVICMGCQIKSQVSKCGHFSTLGRSNVCNWSDAIIDLSIDAMFCHEHDVDELCFSMLLICNDSLSRLLVKWHLFINSL